MYAGEGRTAASGGCNGDSGGPLVCEMGGKCYLHGAVSFGKRNCPTTHYTVFARITSYKAWIEQKIGEYIGDSYINFIKISNYLINLFIHLLAFSWSLKGKNLGKICARIV